MRIKFASGEPLDLVWGTHTTHIPSGFPGETVATFGFPTGEKDGDAFVTAPSTMRFEYELAPENDQAGSPNVIWIARMTWRVPVYNGETGQTETVEIRKVRTDGGNDNYTGGTLIPWFSRRLNDDTGCFVADLDAYYESEGLEEDGIRLNEPMKEIAVVVSRDSAGLQVLKIRIVQNSRTYDGTADSVVTDKVYADMSILRRI